MGEDHLGKAGSGAKGQHGIPLFPVMFRRCEEDDW
jgi:hypothetical protein